MRIDSAKGYYAFLKQRSILTASEDKAHIAALQSVFESRLKDATAEGLSGDKLAEFMFWQGALVGQHVVKRAIDAHFAKLEHERKNGKSDA